MEKKREKAPKQKKKKHSRVRKVIWTILLIIVITLAMLACMAAVYIKNVVLPNAGLELTDYSLNLTTTMYYKNSSTGDYEEMQTLFGEENRVWVTAEEMPKNLLNAAVAIEDKRFYNHSGVDWIRTVKGILCMFTGQDIQGGSTITQQLIKNLTDDNEVTVKRKVMEIFRALEFEKNYSKEDILEWYLNYIYLGEGCSGVYTASYTYFGKHVSQLSLAECASLIGITNNPSKYDPYSQFKVVDKTTGQEKTAKDFNKERQEIILEAMYNAGYITAEERDAAIAEPLVFSRGEEEAAPKTVYSWYVDAVVSDVIRDLQAVKNLSEEAAKATIYSGGLEIYTCMDPAVQASVDAVYTDRNNLNYTSNTGQQLQSAITVVNNDNGDVVAMAGGIGEKTSSRTWNRATQTLRPPGSSIKPLSVYSPGIELNYITPVSTEIDSPYDTENGWPVNADGVYRGRVSIAYAVRNSINTIAVKVLANYVTPEVSYQFMVDRYKIKLVESRTVGTKVFSDIALAPLALGGLTDGVSTFEMAAAYSVFPRNGVYITPRTYSLVLDSNGNVLLDNTATSETVLSERTSYYMTNMLKAVVASGTGTRANFSGQEIAGKTGTTTSRKDLWFAGYTPYYTAVVWTGYDQQERQASGLGNPSTTMWRLVMEKIHAGLPYKDFISPDASKLQTVSICASSGRLATRACSGNVMSASLFTEDVPTGYCNIHSYSSRPSQSTPSHNGGTGGATTGGETTGGETTGGETTGGETTGGEVVPEATPAG